jgi:G3E family GTPase
MASRRLRLPIKCQLIGGQLASGKTSLILRLLATKPKDEVWAVLVNEAGAVGIDQALLSGAQTRKPDGNATAPTDGGVKIKMLGGGCLCCTLSSVTSAALVQLLQSSKPDRLIIEPSGLAHPKALLEMLRGPHLASALNLQPIVSLVDLCTFNPLEKFDENYSSFMAQVALADVLVGTKADICGQQQQDDFITWALALQPRPAKILITTTSEMNTKDLDASLEEAKTKLAATGDRFVKEKENQIEEQISTLFSDGGLVVDEQSNGNSRHVGKSKKVWLTNDPSRLTSLEGENLPVLGHPVRKELVSAPDGTAACGWIFCKDDVFRPVDLKNFAAAALPHLLRLKGIFRIDEDTWVLISIGSDSHEKMHSKSTTTGQKSDDGDSTVNGVFLQPLDGMYQDSRVELIVEKEAATSSNSQSDLGEAIKFQDWDAIESMLVQLLVPPRS